MAHMAWAARIACTSPCPCARVVHIATSQCYPRLTYMCSAKRTRPRHPRMHSAAHTCTPLSPSFLATLTLTFEPSSPLTVPQPDPSPDFSPPFPAHAVAGTVASWYFLSPNVPKNPTSRALKRALTCATERALIEPACRHRRSPLRSCAVLRSCFLRRSCVALASLLCGASFRCRVPLLCRAAPLSDRSASAPSSRPRSSPHAPPLALSRRVRGGQSARVPSAAWASSMCSRDSSTSSLTRRHAPSTLAGACADLRAHRACPPRVPAPSRTMLRTASMHACGRAHCVPHAPFHARTRASDDGDCRWPCMARLSHALRETHGRC